LREFIEKPAAPPAMLGDSGRALVSMGVYIFNAETLYHHLRRDADDADSAHDIGNDVIPSMLREGRRIKVHRFADSCVNIVNGRPYWRDVGTLDAYWEANLDLTRVQPELNMYDRTWPIRTLEEDLPPAKFALDSPDPRGQALDAIVSSGCVVSGAAVIQSLLFTNVVVERGSIVEDSIVLPDVTIGRNVRLRRAVVDKFCLLPDGFSAGLDAAADAERFHVTSGGIVLITPEMLGQPVHAHS
jgi:glucose-1-phosphate adenylyltransferase